MINFITHLKDTLSNNFTLSEFFKFIYLKVDLLLIFNIIFYIKLILVKMVTSISGFIQR